MDFKQEFAELCKKYPNAEVMFIVSSDDINDDYYTSAINARENKSTCHIDKLTLYNDEMYLNKDDLAEHLIDYDIDSLEFDDLSDEEFEIELQKYINKNYEFKTYIIVNV